ncbi:MAG: winged helix-turn-helix domain-containing protein, partial [Myxococcota bacterium]
MQTVLLGDGEVDLITGVVRRVDRTAVLTPSERDLLELLAAAGEAGLDRGSLERRGMAWRAADVAIYRIRRKIEVDPARPMHLVTAYQVGYRLVPATARAARWRGNLPPSRTGLVGRDGLVSAIEDRLAAGPVVLRGPGGVGKSRVAAEVGHRASAEGREVWRLELERCVSADAAIDALGHALRLTLTGSAAHRLRTIRSVLAPGRSLVILDDADRAGDAAAVLADGLGLPILCTARGPVALDAASIDVPPLSEPDAIRLFVERASEL